MIRSECWHGFEAWNRPIEAVEQGLAYADHIISSFDALKVSNDLLQID